MMNTSSQAGLATIINRVTFATDVHPLVHPTALAADAITTVPKAA